MRTKKVPGLVLILLIAGTLSLILNTEVVLAQETRLYFDPPSIIDPTITLGQNFTVDIKIADVEFLYAWQVNMSFDSNVLTFVNVTEGDFLKGQPEGTFGAWRIEESWALFAWTTIGQYPGVSGNGTLATVEFEVKAVGESILKFEFGDPALTYLIGQQEVHPPPHFYDIEFSVDGGYFSNIILAIYTDKYTYTSGEPMDLGLQLNNPMPYPITACVAVWLERPTGPIVVILHAHAIMLPGDFRYSNPSFQSFILPALPPGIYTWHAALLNPSTHAILIEDTAVWEFV